MTGTRRPPSRLGACLVVTAALLAGCSAHADDPAPGSSPVGSGQGTAVAPGSPSAAPSSAGTASTGTAPTGTASTGAATTEPQAPALAAQPAWTAGPGEVQPEVKLAATRFVELAGTWSGGEGDIVDVTARLAGAGMAPDPVTAEALAHPGAIASTVEVLYPQYGGLTEDLASVMVVLRQHLLPAGGPPTSRELILDVRLARGDDGAWTVTGTDPGPPPGPERPTTPLAEQVLANPSLRLPAPARADIRAGRVGDPVLAVLQELGREHVLDVLVLKSGHPTNVFETDRVSNHTVGRAVDVWRVDDQLVVDPGTPRELLTEVMLAAGRAGATEVGGPFDLNGDGPGFFTDQVHADHLHLGVTPGRPPAVP